MSVHVVKVDIRASILRVLGRPVDALAHRTAMKVNRSSSARQISVLATTREPKTDRK